MERLIIENIQLQEAEKRGVTVDDESLARAVGSFASNNNMTLEEFQQTLAADGTSYRQFREEIRSELIITRLQRAMINRRIAISEQDVQALLNSPFINKCFLMNIASGTLCARLRMTRLRQTTRRRWPKPLASFKSCVTVQTLLKWPSPSLQPARRWKEAISVGDVQANCLLCSLTQY